MTLALTPTGLPTPLPSLDADTVVDYLADTPGMRYSLREISDVLGVKPRTLTVWLQDLHEVGRVRVERNSDLRGHPLVYWVPS